MLKNITHFQVPVLDKGYIEIQDMMGDDLAIVNAARTSYLGESKGPDKDKQLLFYLMEQGHMGVFEQVEFKFRCKMPLMAVIHLLRHRTFSFNSQSGRYTEAEDEFYIPEQWRLQSTDNKQGSDGILDETTSDEFYTALKYFYGQSYQCYQQALDAGIAKELARIFLPAYGLYVTLIFKTDARNLMHFLKLRMDSHAQYEIRVYADAIYENFFKPALPWTAEAFEKFILKVD